VLPICSEDLGEATVVSEPFAAHGVCIRVSGELDLARAPRLGDVIAEEIARGHHHVVVDLSAATLLDCASVGTLLRAVAPLSLEPRAAVMLAGPRGVVLRLLTLLQLEQVFEILPDAETAIEVALANVPLLAQGWRGAAIDAAKRASLGDTHQARGAVQELDHEVSP
jgi:anti-sigma B factor antagonist